MSETCKNSEPQPPNLTLNNSIPNQEPETMNKHNQFKKFKTIKQSFTRNRNTGENKQ